MMFSSSHNFLVKHRRISLVFLLFSVLLVIFCFRRFNDTYIPFKTSKETHKCLHINAPSLRSSPATVKFVHQTWKTNVLPPRFQRWSQSWKRCFPNATHILWTDSDNRRLIAKYYPWFLRHFDNLPRPIYRADAIRYILMFHFGGVYTDLDNECLHPFDHLLEGKHVVLGAMSGDGRNMEEGYVQNSFMFSTPRHPVWMDMVHSIMESKATALGSLVGSWALANVVNEYRKRTNQHRDITVYPPQYFNPFSWKNNKVGVCKHFNQMTETELARCRDAFKNTSYVIQYHAHTWGGGKIL